MSVHTKVHGKHGDFAIEAKGLVKRFKTGRSWVEVLKGVDFDARHGDRSGLDLLGMEPARNFL